MFNISDALSQKKSKFDLGNGLLYKHAMEFNLAKRKEDKIMVNKNLKPYRAVIVLLMIGACLALYSQPILADPHPGQSLDVAVTGSLSIINGGILPALSGFNFFNTPVAGLSLTTLTNGTICGGNPCDTLVLNVASSPGVGGLGCSTAGLNAAQKTDINAFVAAGGKVIIYDSECTFGGSVDYTWLTFPFSTTNPGAQGAFGGTLTIVEDNILSHNLNTDPHFIDTTAITTNTDAVGDMNVVDLTTVDPAWCLDLTGTNVIPVSGATHMYAQSGSGLYIYNGLDVDFISFGAGGPELSKLWLFELEAVADSSLLPCLVPVIGIVLEPESAENDVGEDHTVTATLTDLFGTPQEGIEVTFEVISGPNAGETGTSTTDANGEASFTYTGDGGVGTDQIKACFTNQAGDEICSDSVTKEWINTPPDCTAADADPDCLWPPNHKFVDITVTGVTDPDGDPVTIRISSITSDEPTASDEGSGGAKHAPDASGLDTDTASLRSERSGNEDGRVYTINFTASDGRGGMCEGSVEVNVPHDQSDKDCPAIDTGQVYNATDIN